MTCAEDSEDLTVSVSESQTFPGHVRGLVGARMGFYVFNKNPRTSMILEAYE